MNEQDVAGRARMAGARLAAQPTLQARHDAAGTDEDRELTGAALADVQLDQEDRDALRSVRSIP